MKSFTVFRSSLSLLLAVVLTLLSFSASAQIRLWSTRDDGDGAATTNVRNGADFGGRAGLDAFCQADPDDPSGGIPGSETRAFVSVDATDEIRDMPANYNISITETIFDRVGSAAGDQIATNFADLLDGTLDRAVLINGDLNSNPATASLADGSVDAANSCLGWTDGTGANTLSVGRYRDTDGEYLNVFEAVTDGDAAADGVVNCDFFFVSLYCITFVPAAAAVSGDADLTDW